MREKQQGTRREAAGEPETKNRKKATRFCTRRENGDKKKTRVNRFGLFSSCSFSTRRPSISHFRLKSPTLAIASTATFHFLFHVISFFYCLVLMTTRENECVSVRKKEKKKKKKAEVEEGKKKQALSLDCLSLAPSINPRLASQEKKELPICRR